MKRRIPKNPLLLKTEEEGGHQLSQTRKNNSGPFWEQHVSLETKGDPFDPSASVLPLRVTVLRIPENPHSVNQKLVINLHIKL